MITATLFDRGYVVEGIACLLAAKARGSGHVAAACLDEEAADRTVSAMPDAEVIRMAELEDSYPLLATARSNRDWRDFVLTCKPHILSLLQQRHGSAVLVDSDVLFCGPVNEVEKELGDKGLMAVPFGSTKIVYRFNDGVVAASDPALLAEWRRRCLERCEWAPGTSAEFHLDGLAKVADRRFNLGPWNHVTAEVTKVDGQWMVGDGRLICRHFYGYDGKAVTPLHQEYEERLAEARTLAG